MKCFGVSCLFSFGKDLGPLESIDLVKEVVAGHWP